MLKNYLKIAFRNLIKHRVYSTINIVGLAVGMAACLLIYLFVRHEWSYDRFHENADAVYRVFIQETKPDGSLDYRILIPPSLPPTMQKEFPAIRNSVQLVAGNVTIVHQDEPFQERLFEADSTFFEIFSFPLVAGDARRALTDPSGMVLSETTAHKYFGQGPGNDYAHVLGQRLGIQASDGVQDFVITGVMKDAPKFSSLQIGVLISFENYGTLRVGANDWGGRTSTYVLLDDGQDPAALEEAFRPFVATQFAQRIESRRGGGYIGEGADTFLMKLQPLKRLHLDPDIRVIYEQPTHNPLYSYVLSGIAVLILLIASINFMTLSVGRSITRATEVGVRKVMGAQQGQLMQQFWGEALLMSVLGLGVGVGLAVLLLPLFNDLTGQQLSAIDLGTGGALLALAALVLLVGLVAGGYPAAVLSRFQPAAVLKGNVQGRGSSFLTRSLVAVQYTLSIALMIGTGVMLQQLNYLQEKDLGFTDDQVVALSMGRNGSTEMVDKLRNVLLPYEQVRYVSSAGQSFTRGTDYRSWTDADGTPRGSYVFGADYDYVDLMDMEITSGRAFSRAFPSDPATGVVVNEALVRAFELEEPVVGKRLTGFYDYEEGAVILGVVKDFHFHSLHREVQPALLTMHPSYWISFALVKLAPDDVPATLNLLEDTWTGILPGVPFQYSFLDEDVQRQYQSDQRAGQIVGYSAGLALLIACLGLFGLAALVVNRRTKEIGIRKVLGGSVSGIVRLLSGEFVKIVLVATVLAWPLAYFGTRRWLENFAYSIEINYGIFLLAGILALAVALLAVSYQAVKAARSNPVDALRYE